MGRIEDVWAEQGGIRISFHKLESGFVDVKIYRKDEAFSCRARVASFRWERIVEAMTEPESEAEPNSNE